MEVNIYILSDPKYAINSAQALFDDWYNQEMVDNIYRLLQIMFTHMCIDLIISWLTYIDLTNLI